MRARVSDGGREDGISRRKPYAFAYIFISPASAQSSSVSRPSTYTCVYVCVYVCTGESYLKRLTMAIAMVGGDDDTGGSGCARDRLAESRARR